MMIKCRKLLLALAAMLCLCAIAAAEEIRTATDLPSGAADGEIWTATDLTPATADMPFAEDITQEVLINGESTKKHLNRMRDGNYRSYWETASYAGSRGLHITPPEGKAAGAIVIRWRSIYNVATLVQVRNEAGEWETVARGSDDFGAAYIPLPALTQEFRVVAEADPQTKMLISEFQVHTTGRLPKNVQVWQKATGKVDMMQIVAHPDDEILWFGGMLPTYAGEQKKDVLVVCSSYRAFNRRQELLDCLWTAGVRLHPVFLDLNDMSAPTVEAVLDAWYRPHAFSSVTSLLRKHQPDVLVLQDTKGEYGHKVHQAIVYVSQKAVDYAADATYDPDSVQLYGTWDVPKVYIHLYKENQIKMDWNQPLSAFDGKTGHEVAAEAFLCHVSQLKRWEYKDSEKHDNSLFGLWHTTVGPDVIGGDMFENIDKLYAEK